MSMEKMGCSWSGGKDSCFALMQILKFESSLKVLVNMMNENGFISRSHGLPRSILEEQARVMNVPLIAIPTSWNDYEKNFTNTLLDIKSTYDVETMVFGDIDLQQHRDWEEMVCAKAGLKAVLPLWQKPRKELVYQMINAGIEAMIVSCNSILGPKFLGKTITAPLIAELEEMDVDVCGENGEFHTLVLKCPLYSDTVDIPDYDKIKHDDYWFLKWKV